MDKTAFSMAAASTTFMVCKVFSTVNINDCAWSFDAPGNDYQVDAGISTEFRARVFSANLGVAPIQDLTDRLNTDIAIAVRWSTILSQVELGINGKIIAAVGGYNGTMNSSMTFRIASNRIASQFAVMNFAEFIHYNKELTNKEVKEVENYLIAKWGI